jgi:hypothetical protein
MLTSDGVQNRGFDITVLHGHLITINLLPLHVVGFFKARRSVPAVRINESFIAI